MSQEILDRLKKSIVDLDKAAGEQAAKDAMAAGIDSMTAIEQGLAAGMSVLSDLFDEGEVFIPQLLLASKVFEAAVGILTAGLSAEDLAKTSRGTVIVYTVQGDIHSIGKGIVGTMLGASGFKVIDLGVDASADHVIEVAQAENVDIIAGSALMTTTMPAMKELVGLLDEMGLRSKYKCMFGGAPVEEDWAMEFADGYTDSAAGAPKLALKLIEELKGA